MKAKKEQYDGIIVPTLVSSFVLREVSSSGRHVNRNIHLKRRSYQLITCTKK